MSGVEDASLAKVPHQRLRDEDEDERGDGGVRGFSAEEEAVIREDMDLTEGFVEAVMPLSLSQGDKTRRTRRRKVGEIHGTHTHSHIYTYMYSRTHAHTCMHTHVYLHTHMNGCFRQGFRVHMGSVTQCRDFRTHTHGHLGHCTGVHTDMNALLLQDVWQRGHTNMAVEDSCGWVGRCARMESYTCIVPAPRRCLSPSRFSQETDRQTDRERDPVFLPLLVLLHRLLCSCDSFQPVSISICFFTFSADLMLAGGMGQVCIAIVISTSCLLGLLLLAAALYIFVWPLHGNDTTPTGLCVS